METISLAAAGIGAPSVTAASTKVKEFALPQSLNCLVASKCAFTGVNVLVITSESAPSYLTSAESALVSGSAVTVTVTL